MTESIISSAFGIDESVYKTPLGSENPSGENLKYTDLYDDISEAIKEDNARLALGVWEKPLKKANWEKAKSLSVSALQEKSKDLQIASWLTLSLLKLYGFSGLSTGLKIVHELSLNFWDTIYPMPDGDDFDTRLSPLFWIDEKLYIHLKLVPITAKPVGGKQYTYESWENSNIKLKHNEEAVNPVDDYLEYVEISNEEFHTNLEKAINESLDILESIKEFLHSKLINEFPHFVTLEKTLDDIKTLNRFALSHFDKIKKHKESAANSTEADNDDENKPEGELTASAPNTIFDIESAYKVLKKAADYLIENQPDHPSGHVAKMAVDLRNISLKQSLMYNIKDEDKLQKIFNLLNI